MAQLKTTFAGLTLNNPIIVSSSGLTDSPEKIKKLEEAGAQYSKNKSPFRLAQCMDMELPKPMTT